MKKQKKSAKEIRRSKRQLRTELSDAELLQAGKDLAEKTSSLRVLEEDAKRSASDFKARITAAQSEISVISNRVNTGYEYRVVSCTERLDTPRIGKKRITRDDTKELVAIEEMTASEMQRELPIEQPPKEAGAPQQAESVVA